MADVKMASTITKKNSLCRYFVRYGDCFHGENCQFIHALPPQSSPHHVSIPVESATPNATGLQNQVGQQQRQQPQQIPQQQPPPTPQDQGPRLKKLICSFKSDLPNEIDFAMQVATLLANSDNFLWTEDYPLVDAICSSLHVFSCVCDNSLSCYCYPRFWHKMLSLNAHNEYLQAATLPPDMDQSYLKFSELENHQPQNHSKIYRRIKAAAEVLRQFSMTTGTPKTGNNEGPESINFFLMKKKKLKASPSLLKFVSLLLFCDNAKFNLIGLDILSNTASKLSKIPEVTNDPICTKLVQMFQERCVEDISRLDGDIYLVNRSIEVVSKLISSSSRRVSSSIINLIVEKDLVQRIEQFLTSHYDVTLFLSALECCYRISRHQPNLLITAKTRYLIKILVNLLNCEDHRYFTPRALKRIRLSPQPEAEDHPPLAPPLTHPPLRRQNTTTEQPKSKSSEEKDRVKDKQLEKEKEKTKEKEEEESKEVKVTEKEKVVEKEREKVIEKEKVTEKDTDKEKDPEKDTEKEKEKEKDSDLDKDGGQEKDKEREDKQKEREEDKQKPKVTEYSCQWDNCQFKIEDPKQVYAHIFEAHIGPLDTNTKYSCLWSGPNGLGPGCMIKRPKFSLLTHLNDFHCNPNALERAKNLAPIKPPEHPGYAPNAALIAIKRHANSNSEQSGKSRSPLSISVRLTASLILRNLATESPEVKQALENHEPLLSEICMTNGRDESKIIAECLSLFGNE